VIFSQFLSVATLGKSALALSVVASAYSGGGFDTRPQATPMPTTAVELRTTALSFDALLSECVSRYKRGATNTKEACDRAIEKSGLSADGFAAKYRSLLVPPATKTEKPTPTTTPRTPKTTAATTVSTTGSFEALLSECVARYKRSATNTKEACDRAIAASGLSTDAFVAKYRSLLVPASKTEAPKPTATPKPTTAPKLNTADPKVRECLAKYEYLKTLKASAPQTFDAAVRYFNETCNSVLRRGAK
jgi:hypothetical protein